MEINNFDAFNSYLLNLQYTQKTHLYIWTICDWTDTQSCYSNGRVSSLHTLAIATRNIIGYKTNRIANVHAYRHSCMDWRQQGGRTYLSKCFPEHIQGRSYHAGRWGKCLTKNFGILSWTLSWKASIGPVTVGCIEHLKLENYLLYTLVIIGGGGARRPCSPPSFLLANVLYQKIKIVQ